MNDYSQYNILAKLFNYPSENFPKEVNEVQAYLTDHYPEIAKKLQPFVEFVENTTLHEQQELFTRSFDVQSVTTLDLGYVLFGDDYKRGELLANLSREHQENKIDCGSELGDYLPNILRLVAVLKDDELREEMVTEIIGAALVKMIAEFHPERVAKKKELYKKHYKTIIATSEKYSIIYELTLQVLLEVLKKEFEMKKQEMPQQAVDFLKSVSSELDIEKINL